MQPGQEPGFFSRGLARLIDARPGELRALWLSLAYHFFVFASYYIIRPIRDEMGVAGGVDNIPFLFTGTLIGTLIAQPIFAALVARYPRHRFITYTYRFFMLNLVVFFLVLRSVSEGQGIWVGRAFYIWTSVFNLFVVSVFWAFMVDVFREDQSRRLFGAIAAGGTIGAILGSTITSLFSTILGPVQLLLVSAAILEVAVQCARALARRVRYERGAQVTEATAPPESSTGRGAAGDAVVGGSVWAGVTHLLRSPYLLMIALSILLFTIGSTFLYLQQAAIVGEHITDRAVRTAIFARVDLAVNIITLFGQLYLFARLMRWLGIGVVLALLPAISVVGFLGLALAPTLGMVIVFQVVRRAANFAVNRPTREVLYTVVPREDKYKAKSFIDTFVYRAGDQVGAYAHLGMTALGLGVAGVSVVATPLAALWLGVALWLGRRQRALAAAEHDVPAGAAPARA